MLTPTVTYVRSVCPLRRYASIFSFCICCLLLSSSYYTQAQLTLTSGQSVSLNSTVSYPSVSIAGANTTLALGSSANVTVTGGFYGSTNPRTSALPLTVCSPLAVIYRVMVIRVRITIIIPVLLLQGLHLRP